MFSKNTSYVSKAATQVFYNTQVFEDSVKVIGKYLCRGLLLMKLQALVYSFIKKETPAEVFSLLKTL